MDIMEIIFIVLLCFCSLAALATIGFMLQSKANKSKRAFLKKSVTIPDNNISTQLSTADTNSKKPIIPLEHTTTFKKINTKLMTQNLVMIPNVRYSDFISIAEDKKKETARLYSQMPYLIADYVIFNTADMLPVFIVNDVSKENNITKNEMLLHLLQSIGIKIININGFSEEAFSKFSL